MTMISIILDKVFPSRVEKRDKRNAIIRQIEETKDGIAKIKALIERLDEPHKTGLPYALMLMTAKSKLDSLKRQLEWL
jgi:hypothetical protein